MKRVGLFCKGQGDHNDIRKSWKTISSACVVAREIKLDTTLKGIKLIGMTDVAFGVYALGYLLYATMSWVTDLGKKSSAINSVTFVLLALLFLVGVALIRLGVATLKLRSAAIAGNIIVAVMVIMEFLGSQLQYQSGVSRSVRLVLLAYSIWMICYLNRRSIKEQFK